MSKNLLVIGFVWPEPNSTAAGSRMLQLIDFFKENNYKITFVSTAQKSDNSYPLEKLDINTFFIKVNHKSFDELIKEIDPDIVLFDRFLTEEQFGWRVSENCPKALKILDTEDLHFLRYARHQAYKTKEDVTLTHLVNDLTKRELASIYRCDISLIISEYEMNLLQSIFKIDDNLLCYLPFLLDKIKITAMNNYPDFEDRTNFITIGNFKHKPNLESVIFLKKVIWPLIRIKLPDTNILIYGAYLPKQIKQMHDPSEGFIVEGWTEDKEKVFANARVCLAPLHFGAGLKGKLLDTMNFCTPNITTTIGAEGMHNNLPWNGFITNDNEDFALKAVELYNNKVIWEVSQTNGINIINKCYSKERFHSIFKSKINKSRKNLEKLRLNNFTGSMLNHHTMQSTKYLSKWIEEKNEKSRD